MCVRLADVIAATPDTLLCLSVLILTAADVRSAPAPSWSPILNTSQLIERAGYRWERHEVEADDGFRTTVFRMPGPGAPVLLMHGLFVASDSWVLKGKGRDLAFLLADRGLDVWLGDARGNCYSRAHNTFAPNDSVFWDFSVDEMGRLDLPAVIDHIVNATGHDSLVYVGHSLGTTMMYVMAARRPEYVHRVRLMVGLAPAAFFGRYRAAFQRLLLESSSSYSSLFGRAGVHEVLPRNDLLGAAARILCADGSPFQNICLQFLYFMAGFGSLSDFSHVNKTLLPEFVSHLPTGSSPKTLAHLGQLSRSGRFCNYDYGAEENRARYGSASPPDYDLSKTAMPVLNFRGQGDTLVDARDVVELGAKLPNVIGDLAVDNPLFNHMDFIWAEDAKTLVYDHVLEAVDKYTL